MMKLLTLALVLGVAAASCPNDCNGNGECNIYSACECYRNWMGADCSERVCYFGVAYVDTPQGDLNADGFVSDSTYKSRFENEKTWEAYPYYAGWGSVNYKWTGGESPTANADYNGALPMVDYATTVTVLGGSGGEAHFYKECSGKGSCDRGSGICECFAGYEGPGCTRIACPEACSGHGDCRTIEEQKFMTDIAAPRSIAAYKYAAWDAEVSQTCVCEKGWTGLACENRECPKGDDPVTKYEGFTRITFSDTKESTGHDLPTDAGQAMAGLYTSTTPADVRAATDAFGFKPVIIDGTTSNVQEQSTLLWNPWTTKKNAVSPDADGGNRIGVADEWVSENRGIVYDADAQAMNYDMVVTGSKSGARGVQRRFPQGAAGAMAPGCCWYNANKVGGAGVDCTACNFFSMYLSEVTGEFQLGDQIQVTFETQGQNAILDQALRVGNYIASIDTYYNKNKVQRNEEQVLKIQYGANGGLGKANKADGTRFKGYFSLTFTDDFGDEYTTEAISVSVSGAATCSATTNGFGATSNSYVCANAALQGDFTHHGDGNNADPYEIIHTSVSADDLAGGRAVAKQIEKALEALPGKPTGDVQVDYAYQALDDSDQRFFVVRFMEASGDLPALKVNYAFSMEGKLYSNLACGSVGEIQDIVITGGNDDGTDGYVSSVLTHPIAFTGTCQRMPKANAKLGDPNGNGDKKVVAIDILDRGMGCTTAVTAQVSDNLSSTGTGKATLAVIMARPAEEGSFLTCLGMMNGALAVTANPASGSGASAFAAILDTVTVSGAASDTCTDDECTNIWARSGWTDTLGIKGTTENVECSNRGICDYSSGTCACFTGFTGQDCSTQNALAA